MVALYHLRLSGSQVYFLTSKSGFVITFWWADIYSIPFSGLTPEPSGTLAAPSLCFYFWTGWARRYGAPLRLDSRFARGSDPASKQKRERFEPGHRNSPKASRNSGYSVSFVRDCWSELSL